MGIHHKLPAELNEVDVIVAGGALLGLCHATRASLTISLGGLAGCVVAGRLAEADPGLSILVIEQGLNSYGAPEVVHPALYPRNLFPNSKYTLFWQGNQSPQLADRKPIVPSGGTLGGGSAINWMVYTRGQRSDYDSWKTKGWAADDMLPFMKKVNVLGAIPIYTSTDSELV
jgi:alcohol oxidase